MQSYAYGVPPFHWKQRIKALIGIYTDMQRKSDKEARGTSSGGRHISQHGNHETDPSYSRKDERRRHPRDVGDAVDTGAKQRHCFGQKKSLRIDTNGGAPAMRQRRPPQNLRNQISAQTGPTLSFERRIIHPAK